MFYSLIFIKFERLMKKLIRFGFFGRCGDRIPSLLLFLHRKSFWFSANFDSTSKNFFQDYKNNIKIYKNNYLWKIGNNFGALLHLQI